MVIETKTYYPDDILSASWLPEGGSLSATEYNEVNSLKSFNLHRIATPIQKVTKKGHYIH